MQYTLITKTGKIMQFYVKELADTYQQHFGGVVFFTTSIGYRNAQNNNS